MLNSEVSFLHIGGLTLFVFGNFQLEKNERSGGAGIENIECGFAYFIVYGGTAVEAKRHKIVLRHYGGDLYVFSEIPLANKIVYFQGVLRYNSW